MNAITQTLLGGAAVCALATTPAMAGAAPDLHVTALHGGIAVSKTMVRGPARQHLTYNIYISSSVVGVELDKKVKIPFYYKWNGGSREKFKVAPKKTACAKLGTYIFSTTNGGEGYDTTYKLTNPDCHSDHFVSTLIGWFQNNGVRYKGIMNVHYSIEF